MINIAIVDDEETFLNSFNDFIIKSYGDLVEKIDLFTDPEVFLKSDCLYDVVFLDIDLSQCTGIDVAKRYKNKNSLIVFVTSNEALVFKAYNQTTSFGYIRKNKFHSDINDVFLRIKSYLASQLKLVFDTRNQHVEVKYSDIYYIEKNKNYVNIVTSKDTFAFKDTIKNLEKKFEPCGFIKTHSGFIINLEYVMSISNDEIILTNNFSVPVSRNRIKDVKYALAKRMGGLYD